jgi:hypothetical protein
MMLDARASGLAWNVQEHDIMDYINKSNLKTGLLCELGED